MNREEMLERLRSETHAFDLVVVGGGATGVGAAVDAAARGYRVALLEQSDFGKGTSSRSTKLVHGGVRYLRQGNISLVKEALEERGILRRNAPHLVRDLAFVVPSYEWWEAPFYGIGMKVYDVLAGRYGFGPSHLLSKEEVHRRIPTIETQGLRGGVVYHDALFDDSRLLVHLARTAAERGAILASYVRVTGLLKSSAGLVEGVRARDEETGEELTVYARCVVNATGAFADGVRRMDDPRAAPIIRPSQGVHLVLDRAFLPGDAAIMVPRTEDRRVLFAIPWHGRVVVGTTDTPIDEVVLEPRPHEEEIEFLLSTAARYLAKDPSPADVLSVFVGIRPLVSDGEDGRTATLSREHTIEVSAGGLVTVAGGKWTTYRRMAQDVVDHAACLADLEPRPCPTEHLDVHGWDEHADRHGDLAVYGSDAEDVLALATADPTLAERLHPRLPVVLAEVVWAAREEMARTVDDVLARRTRSLLLDARAAMEAAPRVAAILARELGRDGAWAEAEVSAFCANARGYVLG